MTSRLPHKIVLQKDNTSLQLKDSQEQNRINECNKWQIIAQVCFIETMHVSTTVVNCSKVVKSQSKKVQFCKLLYDFAL